MTFDSPRVTRGCISVHPDDTPFNEAWEMRSFLLQHGVPEDMIVGDFYARHTTTNLRNVRCSRCAVFV